MLTALKRGLALAAATLPIASAGGCFDAATSPFSSDDWYHCQKIPSDTHEIYFYYTPKEDTLLLGFHAMEDTDGWTALGINGNGGMKGSNFIVVRQDDDGNFVAEDRYAMDYTMPTLDEQQDVKLLFAEQENGQTAWGVAIPFNSCDADGNDYEILDRFSNMLWAVGNSHDFAYHAQRGQFQANLLQAPAEPSSTEGLSSVDLRMPNVTVVMGEGGEDETNPYICSYFDLEAISSEQDFSTGDTVHVTRFSAILNPDSKQYVHHMILYACDAESTDSQMEHLKVLPECTSMPEGCLEMKWPWAVGGRDTVFPDDVGLPIGGSSRFLMLQIHYYNPSLDEGVVDNSGVKVYYTTDLKEQEAGVMQIIGATNQWQRPEPLPAGQERVSISFATPSECTQNAWKEPLYILGVGHHEHTYGIYQAINIVRDGVNLGSLRPEAHYDFKHQSMEDPVPSLRQLMPGDQITQFCDYDTSKAPGDVVEFGDYTQQEMCYTAIYYYPRQENDSFGAMPAWFNTNTCSQPATTAEFQAADLSLCAESMYSNIPAFFNFEDEVEQPFDLLTVCNNPAWFGELMAELPYLCPEACASETCTLEEIAMQATGVCSSICSDVGMSLYPNVSLTVPVEYGNWACDPTYYPIPSVPEAPACQAKGSDSLDSIEVSPIILKDVSSAGDDIPAGDSSEESVETTEEDADTAGEPKSDDQSYSTIESVNSFLPVIGVALAGLFM